MQFWEERRTPTNSMPSRIVISLTLGISQAGISKLSGYAKILTTDQKRRSIFGFFCRRCHTTFAKLSAIAVLRLCQDYQAWCNGDDTAGYFVAEKDELSCMFSHIVSNYILLRLQQPIFCFSKPWLTRKRGLDLNITKSILILQR